MRYNIGQEYVFINTRIAAADKDGWAGFSYYPGQSVITSISMVKLRCIEHHKVYASYDDRTEDPTHDGFVFEDAFGNRWNNQYPNAAYGQMDTSNDFRVRWPENLMNKDNVFDSFRLVENVLEDLREVLKAEDDPRRRKEIIIPSQEERYRLQEYFNSIVFNAEQMLGKKIKIEPYRITKLDGEVIVTDVDEVTFVNPTEHIAQAA
jgi:hypothetical protein